MIKKVLILGGVGLAGFGLYRYFKYQVDLALKYDYKIKKFRYLGIDGNNINVSAVLEITNNSNFRITINSFDLQLLYNGKKFSDVISKKQTIIEPKGSFEVEGQGIINVSDLKQSLPDFIMNVAKRKPIDIEVNGNMKINFMNINSTITFNKQKFNYSADLISDVCLGDKYDSVKQKYSKIFGLLGIK